MKYCGLNTCDLANGEGIRVSLFVSGCKFHCKNCFNEKEQDFSFGKDYTEKTKQALLEEISSPNVDGLSILGGDPLWQDACGLDNLCKLCDEVHKMGKTVWLWSGFTLEQIFEGKEKEQITFETIYRKKLVSSVDVFVDGRFEEKKKDLSLAWRGSSNQRVIDMNKTKEKGEIVLYET